MNRIFGLFCTSLLLSACATPPGQLKEADFVSRTVKIPVPVPVAVSSFYDGLRYCGPETSGLVLVTAYHGIPDCSPARPDGSTTCDLYLANGLGGRSSHVLGRADFAPVPEGTILTLRIQKYIAPRTQQPSFDAWEKMARGAAKEACSK